MTRYLLLILLLLSLSPSRAQTTFPPGTSLCDTGDWHLVWQDEFNGPGLDTSKWYTWFPSWNARKGIIDTYASSIYSRRGSGVVFMDSNVTVSNGTCKLMAFYHPTTWVSINDTGMLDTFRRNYTGAVIHTWNASFKKGRYEIRCKLPEANDDVHITFWTWGDRNRNEIDFFEWYGDKHRNTDVVHYWHPEGQQADADDYRFNSSGWHTFTSDWDENFIRFYVDNKLKHTFYRYKGRYKGACTPRRNKTFTPNPAAQDSNEPCQLIVSLDADRSDFIPIGTARIMEIDYIRVYERKR